MTNQRERQFSIADKPHLENLFAILMLTGCACPKCGYGTRKTSNLWRRCKRKGCELRIKMTKNEAKPGMNLVL